MRIEVEEITSVDELHKSLKGDGVEKAEPIREVEHIEDTAFQHPDGLDPRHPVGPTDDIVGEHGREWEGDQAIGQSSLGDDNTRGTASAVPRGSPDEITGVGPATGGTDGYGYPAIPVYSPQGFEESMFRGVTADQLDEAVEKAGQPGTRGGQVVGYDSKGKPIYASAKERAKKREAEERKKRGPGKEEIKLGKLRREQEEKKKKYKVEEQARGGKVVGHATGGRPIYELKGGKKYTKERAAKYGKKSMNPHEDFQLSDENIERAFKIGPITIGKKKPPPAKPAAAAQVAASGALTPGKVTTHKVTPTAPGVKKRTPKAGEATPPKPLPGAKPKFTMQEFKKRKAALTKKGVFANELGGFSAFMKSMAVLAADAGTIRAAEDLAWDTGVEDDEYQALRTLMRSFPPRMWQFLKRVANKSIDPRTAIQHVAACIGEMNKAVQDDIDMRKSLGDIGDPLGAEAIDPELIPNLQGAMDNAINQAEEDAKEYRKSRCATHAYTSEGYAGATNFNGQCTCHRIRITKAQIADRAFKILQQEEDLCETMDWLGVDQLALRIYVEAA